jgi:hypothetical protein
MATGVRPLGGTVALGTVAAPGFSAALGAGVTVLGTVSGATPVSAGSLTLGCSSAAVREVSLPVSAANCSPQKSCGT